MRLVLLAAALLVSSPAFALTQAEIDNALAVVDVSIMRECIETSGDRLVFDTEARDLNGDGVDEIVAYARSSGSSGCFGRSGRDVHLLIRDDAGRWEPSFGFDAHSLSYIERKGSPWPDIEIGGPGFCFPIWRHEGSGYGIWKTCEGGKLIFAEGVRDGAVPSGEPKRAKAHVASNGIGTQVPVEIIDISSLRDAMPYNHNGSIMAVDPVRGIIAYDRPKSSIAKTVKRGTVLFRGKPWSIDNTDNVLLDGVAFTFKRGCDAAQYDVRGRYHLEFRAFEFTLEGGSPQRSKTSCEITGHTINSANAKLKFEAAWD